MFCAYLDKRHYLGNRRPAADGATKRTFIDWTPEEDAQVRRLVAGGGNCKDAQWQQDCICDRNLLALCAQQELLRVVASKSFKAEYGLGSEVNEFYSRHTSRD